MSTPGRGWVKAARSIPNGACVELNREGDTVSVRHSGRPDTMIQYTVVEFAAFLDGAKNGEFDGLVEPTP